MSLTTDDEIKSVLFKLPDNLSMSTCLTNNNTAAKLGLANKNNNIYNKSSSLCSSPIIISTLNRSSSGCGNSSISGVLNMHELVDDEASLSPTTTTQTTTHITRRPSSSSTITTTTTTTTIEYPLRSRILRHLSSSNAAVSPFLMHQQQPQQQQQLNPNNLNSMVASCSSSSVCSFKSSNASLSSSSCLCINNNVNMLVSNCSGGHGVGRGGLPGKPGCLGSHSMMGRNSSSPSSCCSAYASTHNIAAAFQNMPNCQLHQHKQLNANQLGVNETPMDRRQSWGSFTHLNNVSQQKIASPSNSNLLGHQSTAGSTQCLHHCHVHGHQGGRAGFQQPMAHGSHIAALNNSKLTHRHSLIPQYHQSSIQNLNQPPNRLAFYYLILKIQMTKNLEILWNGS